MSVFANQFDLLMTAFKVSNRDIADALGVDSTIIWRYRNEKNEPVFQNVIKITEYFNKRFKLNLTVDYFTGNMGVNLSDEVFQIILKQYFENLEKAKNIFENKEINDLTKIALLKHSSPDLTQKQLGLIRELYLKDTKEDTNRKLSSVTTGLLDKLKSFVFNT